jgi:gamma-glutamylcyclotransferase (GGCT)/AIG2-like uncharacterized protein YtfP
MIARHVFTYGSLMFDPVWAHVVRGRYASVRATVPGVRRGAVMGEHYPGCRRDAAAHTQGRLYLDVNAADLARLDAFEGEHYWREAILVKADDEHSLPAWMYLYKLPEKLTKEDWSLTQFERDGMAKFLATYSPTRLGDG